MNSSQEDPKEEIYSRLIKEAAKTISLVLAYGYYKKSLSPEELKDKDVSAIYIPRIFAALDVLRYLENVSYSLGSKAFEILAPAYIVLGCLSRTLTDDLFVIGVVFPGSLKIEVEYPEGISAASISKSILPRTVEIVRHASYLAKRLSEAYLLFPGPEEVEKFLEDILDKALRVVKDEKELIYLPKSRFCAYIEDKIEELSRRFGVEPNRINEILAKVAKIRR